MGSRWSVAPFLGQEESVVVHFVVGRSGGVGVMDLEKVEEVEDACGAG